MKSLQQHIEEKLIINKDYKNIDNINWLHVNELCGFEFINFSITNHCELRLNKYNIKTIDKEKDNIYWLNLTSNSGNMCDCFIHDKKSNVLYCQNGWKLVVLIHPNDTEKITKLYNSIDYLDTGTKYTIHSIMTELNINYDFVNCLLEYDFEYNDDSQHNEIKKLLSKFI